MITKGTVQQSEPVTSGEKLPNTQILIDFFTALMFAEMVQKQWPIKLCLNTNPSNGTKLHNWSVFLTATHSWWEGVRERELIFT